MMPWCRAQSLPVHPGGSGSPFRTAIIIHKNDGEIRIVLVEDRAKAPRQHRSLVAGGYDDGDGRPISILRIRKLAGIVALARTPKSPATKYEIDPDAEHEACDAQ